jgi:hypothetical protein
VHSPSLSILFSAGPCVLRIAEFSLMTPGSQDDLVAVARRAIGRGREVERERERERERQRERERERERGRRGEGMSNEERRENE